MRSMTGYGEASGENARHGITVSLRAVNHRFLDLQLRIGEELRGSEAALRDAIGKEVARGRVEARVAKLDALRGRVREEMAANRKRRLAGLLAGQGLDEGRVAQEVALLVDRNDVSEEIDRLRSHVEHFRAVMREGGAAGKRLDFLTQEVFRELNTLGAKCRNAEMTRAVLDAKVTCEQIREQVQNVE